MPELSYRSSYPVRVLQCITLGGDCTAQSHARTPLPMALTGSDSSRHYPYAGTSLTALASLIALVPFLVPSHLCAFRQQELTGPRRRPFRETCSSLARQSWVRAPHPMMSVVPSHHALLPPPPPIHRPKKVWSRWWQSRSYGHPKRRRRRPEHRKHRLHRLQPRCARSCRSLSWLRPLLRARSRSLAQAPMAAGRSGSSVPTAMTVRR